MLYHMSNIDWTKTDDGFCTEISQFNGQTFITLPDGTRLGMNWFTPHRDNENEITHWDTTHRGQVYTLFND